MENTKKFLVMILQAIVDEPDVVSVEATSDEMGVLLLAKVAPADMGKVIGKQGKTAEAIRELLRVVGFQVKAKISFKLEEPPGRERPARPSRDEGYDDIKRDLNNSY